MIEQARDTAPFKAEPLMRFAHRVLHVLTLDEQAIALSLATTVVFAIDRLTGVIG